jgi:hypothetical protein
MDEVYRAMFLLEARRPGAEMRLALALLRAGAEADALPDNRAMWRWLKKICPICLAMIDEALDGPEASLRLMR